MYDIATHETFPEATDDTEQFGGQILVHWIGHKFRAQLLGPYEVWRGSPLGLLLQRRFTVITRPCITPDGCWIRFAKSLMQLLRSLNNNLLAQSLETAF